jgi:hypothetical protein
MTERPYECSKRKRVENGELGGESGVDNLKCLKCDGHGTYTVAGMERSCWEYVIDKMLSEREGEGEAVVIRGEEVR